MSAPSSTAQQVLLPELGESVTEGVIVEWRKGVGDVVEAGDILVDITTDKVDVEVPAPAGGRIVRIAAEPGDTVAVGALLAELVPAGDDEPVPNGGPPASDTAPEAPAAPAAEARAVPIVLPDMESVTEATVIEWRKAVGEAVAQDEIVVEVSTDKVDLEVPAPAGGTLARIDVQAGDTFPVTQPLGEIAAGAAPAAAPAATPDGGSGGAAQAAPGPAGDLALGGHASPLARRIAGQHGLDLESLPGSGPGGQVRRRDVLAAVESGPAPAATAPAAPAAQEPEGAVALKGPPAALAGYMDESLTIPTATSFRTVNVGVLDERRRALNAALAAAGRTEKLSYTHLVAWAIIRTVQRWPVMGTGFARIDGAPHRLERSTVNLGLAVDAERKDGTRTLMVPVIRAAETLGFRGFVEAYADLVARARTGQVKPDELRGATVTLTNPGGLGTVASVPRLMAGQGTIVATGSIALPPGFERMPKERLAELGVDKVMTMTSTYDHRVIQGAESGSFLRDVAALLAGEEGFYEEVAASMGVALPAAEAPAAAPVPARAAAPAAEAPDMEVVGAVAAAMSLVKALRTHGHLAARLDPLGSEPPGDPALTPEQVGLTPELMAKVPAELLRVYVPGETFADAFPRLRDTYCGTIAYEIEHIGSHQQRVWLREQIETGTAREPLPPLLRLALLEQLIAVDAFERFLRRTYLGQKTFSIEGLDVLIPMLTETMELVSEAGARDVVLGMAHRGRLAAISHVVGRPSQSILAEFEGHMEFESGDEDHAESAGDVKYHLGAEGTYLTRAERTVTVNLAANPSHLEQVNAVAEGRTRARQTIRKGDVPRLDPAVAVPLLVHGDAAFPGQGVVAETLNLSALSGYSTGGTVHIIGNNQVGFTTDPQDNRSTRYASDLAKGFDIPIIHVNADDVEACIAAVRLAVAFRQRFGRDALIDLIGYRRLGHNELDEPAYTQPVMARTIKAHPPVSRLYGDALIAEGLVTREHVDEIIANAEKRMSAAHAAVTGHQDRSSAPQTETSGGRHKPKPVATAVSAERLTSLNEQLLRVPEGFTVHPKLAPQLERRREAMGPEGGIAWAHAEALAIASLLTEGVPVRLSGQDAARGTFSQRHLELHDVGSAEPWNPRTGRVHVPMAHLMRASATFELHNSPLSEAAAVGFEYGYSTQAPETLVIWEAQYGDFANGAQIMIDQFITSGRVKWGETSRLTLLLPHGYEGNGPEHSSARMERFLQMAAEGNIRVADCTTAAQYFHLLRKQALSDELRPLALFTPKSLLRLRAATSRLEDLVEGRFRPVLDDPRATDRERVRRLILCTGKVFYELDGHADRAAADDLAIARLELLYPFPEDELRELIEAYPGLTEVTWVQEEPLNMGAWNSVSRRIAPLLPSGIELGYVGRPPRASPSEGYPQAHQAEQARILGAALAGAPVSS